MTVQPPWQVLRFGGVGVVATLLHVTIATLVQIIAQAPPLASNLAGFCGAALLSYLGHAHVTFGETSSLQERFPRFAVVALGGLVTSSLITHITVTVAGAPFTVAMALVALVVPVTTFLLLKAWVFGSDVSRSRALLPGLLLVIAVSIGCLLAWWGQPINHDTAWYLIATRRWLAGAALYQDIIEVNPPLNFYYTVPAILLADGLGISDTNAQFVILSTLLGVSLTWCWTILASYPGLSLGRRFLLLFGIAFALTVPALSSLAQREHLLTMFLMPWLLGQAVAEAVGETSGTKRTRDIALRAGFAALGICLKPYFLLFPIGLTLRDMWRKRSARPMVSPSNLTIGAIGAAYVAFVAWHHPTYLTTIVPAALLVYGDYGFDAPAILGSAKWPVVLAFLGALLFHRRRALDIPAVGLFGVTALAALGSYFWQWTGYAYQAIPHLATIVLGCFWILAHTKRQTVSAFLAVLTLVDLSYLSYRTATSADDMAKAITEMLKDHRPARFLFLTTHVAGGPPSALQAGAEWVSRYPAYWYLPGALNGLARTDCGQNPALCAKLNALLEKTRVDIIEDIKMKDPTVILVDRHPGYIKDAAFSWDHLMSNYPAFQELMDGYTQKEGPSPRFRVLTKSPAKPPKALSPPTAPTTAHPGNP